MMASATPLKDIDEQFLQCCICKEQLKEPKILPCLHRYCQECLKKFAKEGAKKIECVTCREQHTLPKDGIGGLKTDLITKNIIEFIQLQDSVKVNPLRDCIHCNKNLKASAFCFKCNDFLCETCHEFHASSSIVKDHHPHIFSLREAEAANLTIQKLSSLKEAPICQAHPGKLSELCCTTCDNLPVCMPCTYGEHKGHNLTEVTSLAKIQRGMLRGEVVDLMQYKEEAYQMPEEIRKIKEKLDHNVKGEELKRQEQLDAEEGRIKKAIRKAEEELKRKQVELEGEVKARTLVRKQDLGKQMEKLREEYERICEEERCRADASLKKLQEENKRETKRLQEGLRVVNDEFEELMISLKIQKDEQAKKIKALSDHFDGIVKRFEIVTMTVNCFRAAEDEWADVQCIPDVCRAINLLSKDVKKGRTGLGNLSAVESEPPSADMFRPPAGSWACDTCWVNNPGDKTACMACSTPKPGAQSSQLTASSISFVGQKGPSLFGSPSGSPFSFKAPSGFPSTTSAFSAGSLGMGSKPTLFSLGETSKQSDSASPTPVGGFKAPPSVGFTFEGPETFSAKPFGSSGFTFGAPPVNTNANADSPSLLHRPRPY